MSITSKTPSVGIVIRTFNSEKYLAESIESVLHQHYEPKKILVVDGGSTDATEEIIAGYDPHISLISQKNPGLGGAAQDGIDALDTDLIAFQDSDDIWTPGRLAIMVEELLQRPHCAAVLGSVEHFLSPELNETEHKNLVVHPGLQPGFGLPALLAHKWVFDEIGPFVVGLAYGEYIDFIDKFRRKGLHLEQLAISSLKRRVHRSNYTQGTDIRNNMLKSLQVIMARRRNKSE